MRDINKLIKWLRGLAWADRDHCSAPQIALRVSSQLDKAIEERDAAVARAKKAENLLSEVRKLIPAGSDVWIHRSEGIPHHIIASEISGSLEALFAPGNNLP